jgi:DNA-binding NtrC family response regulator
VNVGDITSFYRTFCGCNFVKAKWRLFRLSTRILQRLGYHVFAAVSPSKALTIAKDHHGNIDLLVTDVVMPEMNGRELAAKLRARHPAMKCLYMSGYTANVIAHHGVLDDGVHFIQKPFTRGDLAASVRSARVKTGGLGLSAQGALADRSFVGGQHEPC